MLAIAPNAKYQIGNTHYNVLPGIPRPGIDYKIQYSRRRRVLPTKEDCRSARGHEVRYLQWLLPKDKTLAGINSITCEIQTVKDKETGKIRWLRIRTDENWKRLKQKSYKNYTYEIPHWDFDPSAVQLS